MTSPPSTRPSLLFRMRNPQDHAAWVEFIGLYETAVYRILRQHGLQDADARELMQDLFLALSRNIDRWDPDKERGSFRGWLRRVCRNLVINWARRRRRTPLSIGGLPAVSEPNSAGDANSRDDSPSVTRDQWQALAELPAPDGPESLDFDREVKRALFHRAAAQVRTEVRPGTWQAFWETCVLGTSTAETAAKLGLTPGAVRVARCRVLARLKILVREWEKSE